jgi:hypothetical protein
LVIKSFLVIKSRFEYTFIELLNISSWPHRINVGTTTRVQRGNPSGILFVEAIGVCCADPLHLLLEIWMAETKKYALAAFGVFVETRGVKYDKAVECLVKDRDALLAFYDFPAEHWKHLRTTNVIESAFATVLHAPCARVWSRKIGWMESV